jgi:hypothetical protein
MLFMTLGSQSVSCALLGFWLAVPSASPCVEASEARLHGQLLYVPVYSEAPYGDKGLNINLTATLSIRNTDRTSPLSIRRVDYYGTDGTLLRSYVKQATILKPMASAEYVVQESDRSGGISASFLVEWESVSAVSPCVAEAVMVNSSYNRGIAFTSPARVLEEKP